VGEAMPPKKCFGLIDFGINLNQSMPKVRIFCKKKLLIRRGQGDPPLTTVYLFIYFYSKLLLQTFSACASSKAFTHYHHHPQKQ